MLSGHSESAQRIVEQNRKLGNEAFREKRYKGDRIPSLHVLHSCKLYPSASTRAQLLARVML